MSNFAFTPIVKRRKRRGPEIVKRRKRRKRRGPKIAKRHRRRG